MFNNYFQSTLTSSVFPLDFLVAIGVILRSYRNHGYNERIRGHLSHKHKKVMEKDKPLLIYHLMGVRSLYNLHHLISFTWQENPKAKLL